MLWDGPLIAKLLELYIENRVLWDQKHNYSDKKNKQVALQAIQNKLGIPLSPSDIHRKFRTMRAAYQVELRNINTAKIRGFFYKPSLHWFEIFHKFMEETKEIKGAERVEKPKKEKPVRKPTPIIVEEEPPFPAVTKKYFVVRADKESATKRKRAAKAPQPVEVVQPVEDVQPIKVLQLVQVDQPREGSRESSEMEYSSDESDDEFQTFADHIAEQLRTMSVHRAVMIQNQIQTLFANERKANEALVLG